MTQTFQKAACSKLAKYAEGHGLFYGDKKEFLITSAFQAEELSCPLLPTEDTATPKRSPCSARQTRTNVGIKAPLVPPPPGAHSCAIMLLCCLLRSVWALLCCRVFVGVEKLDLVFTGKKGSRNLCCAGRQRAHVSVDIQAHSGRSCLAWRLTDW